jgi:hypothetical protein
MKLHIYCNVMQVFRSLSLALLVAFLLGMLSFSCKKEESSGVSNSGILTVGDQKDFKLISLVPYPEGGFIVGAESRASGNQSIKLMKYDDNFELEWQKTMGGSNSNKVHRIFVDKDKNILVVGMTYGFNQDTLPLSVHKFWWPYAHLLDVDGLTIWEEGISGVTSSAGLGSGILERTSDVIQDNSGDYLIGGEFVNNGIHSAIIKLSASDRTAILYKTSYNKLGKVEALYKHNNTATAFNFWQDSMDATPYACLFNLEYSDTTGTNLFYDRVFEKWPWSQGYVNERVAGLKLTLKNGAHTFNYFFNNSIYRFNLNSNEIKGNAITSNFKGIISANTTFDGNFVIAQSDGSVYETDEDFSVINKFKTNWRADKICKLYNNEFVLAIQKGKSVYLIHYDKNGKVVEDE